MTFSRIQRTEMYSTGYKIKKEASCDRFWSISFKWQTFLKEKNTNPSVFIIYKSESLSHIFSRLSAVTTCCTVINNNSNLPVKLQHHFVSGASFPCWKTPLSVYSSSPSCPSVLGECLAPELCPHKSQQSDLPSQWSSVDERSPAGFGWENWPRLAEPVQNK